MTVIIMMQNDYPIGVYKTTRGVKSRIKAIKHKHPDWIFVKHKGVCRWVAKEVNQRDIFFWTESFKLGT